MKKPKKKLLKKPQLPSSLKERPFKRLKSTEEKVSDALSSVPRITNETVTEHREEVLSSARKYIYPLQHSKHRVVRISIGLFVTVLVSFFAITLLSLYKFQHTSTFIYDVTRIIPFPVAKAGGAWISYESYLFELRRNMHYYRTQQQADFSTKDGKQQLKRLKQQALAQVVQDAYVKQLADKHKVSISNRAVDNQVALVRSQNRLGTNDRVFKDVLSEFWGWSPADFKRELKQQMLQQAVVLKLDTKAHDKANYVLERLKAGTDFATMAAQASDDAVTNTTGGQYLNPITAGDRELSPLITAEIFRLKKDELSNVISSGYTLEIIKVIETDGKTAKAAHIQINLADINTFVKPLEKKNPGHQYIRF